MAIPLSVVCRYHWHLRVNLNTFQQLIHLVIAQFLSQTGQDISQFTCTDESVSILVKHLESSDEFLGGSCGLESVGAVQNVEKRVVVNILGCCVCEIGDLSLGRVLTEGSKKVAEGLARDGAGTLLVEEGESFLVFCVGLCGDVSMI